MSRQVFTLPDLGEGLTEAELVRWLVAVGDVIAVDAPVAEVETAKATVEVPSPYGGVVAALHGEEGSVLDVGAPLVSVDEVAADVPPAAAAAATAYVAEERAGSGAVLIGYGTSEAASSGRGRRGRRRTPAAAAPATAEAGGPVPVRSPVVRELARRHRVDLRALSGSGPGGVITRTDVERAVQVASTSGTAAVSEPATAAPVAPAATLPTAAAATAGDRDARTGLVVARRVPLTGVRRAVVQTLRRSRQEVPEATTWVDVDVTELLALRPRLARPDERAPGLLALVGRFVVAGLSRFPELNSRVDTGTGEVALLQGVNLGIAAQTERGLVVPAVRDAHLLSVRGLDREVRRLTAAAREGTATPAELTSGSFTLNNYGVLGVDGSAAIINHPEVAILGMGRVLPRPWVVAGEVVARDLTQLSLVFDHRVCDGGTAGGLLRFVADCMEDPVAALADL